MAFKPGLYPVQILSQHMQELARWNPLFSTLQSIRDLMLHSTLVEPMLIGESLLTGMTTLAVGWACFHLMRPGLMDLL